MSRGASKGAVNTVGTYIRDDDDGDSCECAASRSVDESKAVTSSPEIGCLEMRMRFATQSVTRATKNVCLSRDDDDEEEDVVVERENEASRVEPEGLTEALTPTLKPRGEKPPLVSTPLASSACRR